MKSVGLLIGVTVVFWAVTAYPLQFIWGEESLLFSAAAAGLCLVPMLGTLVWVRRSEGASADLQLLAVLGGTGLRMTFVMAGGMALFFLVPGFHYTRFWILVVVYYLFTLTVEVVLLARRPGSSAPPPQP